MLTAADVMTTEVFSVPPEAPIHDVAKLMYTKRIGGVPVIDAAKRVIGMISKGDLIRHAQVVGERRRPWWVATFTSTSALAHDYIKTHARIARDVMTQGAITVSATATLAEIAKVLEQHRIKRVPVVEDGEVIGMVTRVDLLQALAAVDAASAAS
jgi:CBS domain-containing protein